MARIAIILVHYQTANLLVRAVEALRADLSSSGLDADLIVVDNGSSEADRLALAELNVCWIDAGGNRGYAGGINLGVSRTDAELLFFMNCDVEVLPGCISALAQALQSGAGAVGPRFYWDRARSVLLPPTERADLLSEISRRLAGSSDICTSWARARWRRHARRHWTASQPLCSSSLSGALLGVHRDAWNKIGPFDEGFKLYFEETDWLQRLTSHGLTPLYVPEAQAVHLYNQSASKHPESSHWFAQSAERYQMRHYGKLVCRLLKFLPSNSHGSCDALRLRDRTSRLPSASEEFGTALARVVSPDCRAIEISPLLSGFPAACVYVSPGQLWKLPTDLWEYMAPATYSLRILSEKDKELQHFLFDVSDAVSDEVSDAISDAVPVPVAEGSVHA